MVLTMFVKQNPASADLPITQDICAVLQGTGLDSCASECLGYLDSCCHDNFRHSFFRLVAPRSVSESICVSTKEILSRPEEAFVTIIDQLTLARNFAMAVLKFNSTPWLSEFVTIHDFSFFLFGDDDLLSCLQTAHLGFNFFHAASHEKYPTEDMAASEAIEEAKLTHGVRNLTLWGLGIVLYVPFQQQPVSRDSRSGPVLQPRPWNKWWLCDKV